jgi:hypothetical protein
MITTLRKSIVVISFPIVYSPLVFIAKVTFQVLILMDISMDSTISAYLGGYVRHLFL